MNLTWLKDLTKVGSLFADVLGAWKKAEAVSDWSEWEQEQINQSLQSLQEATLANIKELDRWYLQEIAYIQEKEREYVANVQAYYGARGVEIWGSAIQKATEAINKAKNFQDTLYQNYLLKRKNILISYENKARQLTYSQSWLENKAASAQREKWFEIGKDIWTFTEKGGLKSLERLWSGIRNLFD